MNNSYKVLKFIIISLLITYFSSNIYSENIFLYAKTAFKNSQFWEKQENHSDSDDLWKVYSNFFGGSLGAGMEMVIWDNGIKRGSRLYFKGGLDLDFAGVSFIGGYKDPNEGNMYNYEKNKLYEFDKHGGAFYVGLNWDLFFGGTFPKTNLLWGFGCSWNFLFPAYAPQLKVADFKEKYAFYAVPSIILGYDFFIPKTNYKITPQLRAGFTCMPFIPDDLIKSSINDSDFYPIANFSGLYVELSAAFSFISFQWKK